MPPTTSIKLESAYKGNYSHFIMHLFLALSFGPLTILIIVSTAITNKVDDPISWIVLVLIMLFFCYFSYGRFKYIYYTYFKDHSVEIDYENKSILYLPFKEIILIEKVNVFAYSNEFKNYRFRNNDIPVSSFEAKRNPEFENVLLKFSLECKVK